MGYSLRTDRYRYTEWQPRNDPNQVLARELYDHQSDPRETKNVADEADKAEVVKDLSARLRKGWRQALPADSRRG
jgi:hypothetical protein